MLPDKIWPDIRLKYRIYTFPKPLKNVYTQKSIYTFFSPKNLYTHPMFICVYLYTHTVSYHHIYRLAYILFLKKVRNFFFGPSYILYISSVFYWFWYIFRLLFFILARRRRKFWGFCVPKLNFPLIFGHFSEHFPKIFPNIFRSTKKKSSKVKNTDCKHHPS